MTQPDVPPTPRSGNEPAFVLESHRDAFDVRRYAPYLVAEVVVPGPADEVGAQGFRLLAAYIFGKNRGARTMAMTTPVTQTQRPITIPMTTPVTQNVTAGGFLVRFVMPPEYTLATLPEPLDDSIALREVPEQRIAVLRYSGSWSQRRYEEHLAILRAAVIAAGFTATGEPTLARYNAPYVLPFLRRNEVWLPLP
jgi:hypothetical protein